MILTVFFCCFCIDKTETKLCLQFGGKKCAVIKMSAFCNTHLLFNRFCFCMVNSSALADYSVFSVIMFFNNKKTLILRL